MRAPRIDPELRAALLVVGGVFPPTITPDLIPFMRRSYASGPREDLLAGLPVRVEDLEFPAFGGETLAASVVSPQDAVGALPAILAFHSGGMMFGDRFSGMDVLLSLVADLGVRLVTVEYRLAPEHRHPVPVEDCYAALCWLDAQADALGVDRSRVIMAGASAGGGLAAGVALLSRERGGPRVRGLVLDYPMLDDRGITPSTRQFDGVGVWDRVSNETGWRALLGDAVATDAVPSAAAPARESDLTGLPPTFIGVGSEEIFRDEAIAFASRLWESGVAAELHVWPGAFHACDIFAPHAAICRAMLRTRREWIARILAR